MILRYETVYVKPDVGSSGFGIYRIERLQPNQYLLRSQTTKVMQGTSAELGQATMKIGRKKPYLLQQGIQSLTTRGLPFDLRVHMQRVNGEWVYGGAVGKLGKRYGVVTNRFRGGQPVPIETLLAHHLNRSPIQQKSLMEEIKRVAFRIARLMQKRFPYPREYGIDIGIDNKQLWIYEVNTSPGITVFRKLSDHRPVKRILLHRRQGNIKRR